MQYIIKSNKSQIFNCGYGKGLSVLKMIKTANKLIGSKIHYEFGPRKKGDIQYSVSNSKKFIKFFKWKPKYNDINKILRSAIDWEKKLK